MTWHELVDPVFSGRLCLTLLHSLWQVALLALIAWCVDRLWRSRSVEWRYAVNVVALLATLAAMPITYALIDVDQRPTEVAIATPILPTSGETRPTSITTSPAETELVAPTKGQTLASAASASSSAAHFSDGSSPRWLLLAPWIVAFYAAGVASMLARLVVAIIRANRLAAHAELVTDGPLVETLRSLARKWSMSVVPALARAEQIVMPKMVGLVRPTILLPASAISGLSMDELEMILAHELAHVRRYDMWVNLIQRLAEAVLFFNPALWYLSRRVSTLREYCCDEITCRAQTTSAPGPRVRYATALLRVVELAKPNTATTSDLASLAAAGRSPSEMRRRVARLVGEPLREPLRISRGGVLVLIAVTALMLTGPVLWQSNADSASAQVADTQQVDSPSSDQESPENTDAAGKSDEDSTVHIKVVIARHVLLLEGREIITWPQLEEKIATLPDPSLAHPHFYVTRGAREAGIDKSAKDEMWRLHRKFELKGHSEGSLRPRTDFRYDRIKTAADLAPDEALRMDGKVVDERGEPVAGAEVLLVTPVDESISYKSYHIALVRGKVRNRLEHVMAISGSEGQFALYPPKNSKHFIVAMHPDAGCSLVRSDRFTPGSEIKLLPWAGLISEFDEVANEEQSASLTTRVRAANGWPELVFNQYWSDLKEKVPGQIFPYKHIPPMLETTVQRDFRNKKGGGSIGLAGASVSLLPGEVRQLGLGPLSPQQRAMLEQLRKGLQTRRGSRPSDSDGGRASENGTSDAAVEDVRKKGPVLRGRITDESGDPLPDVQVVLYGGAATRFRGQEATTDANGEYRFDPLKTGARLMADEGPAKWLTGVQFEHDEYVPADGKSWRDIQVPMVKGHEEVRDLTMTLGGKVTGIVVDAESGQPMSELGLRIRNGFINGKSGSDFAAHATTDVDGKFASGPIFPGRYVIDINDGNFQGKYKYPKIGKVVVRADETSELRMTTRELPELQDPFRITGTAIGDDGKSMVYGGVYLRITGSDSKLRTSGGGIDGRNVFNRNFGPVERIEPTENSPYGVGTYDVELSGSNQRFGYKLVKRTPSEPLRITDDPHQRELQNGIRYIRPNQPLEFKLVFAKDDDMPRVFRLSVVGPDGSPVSNVEVEIRTKPAPTAEQIHDGELVRTGKYGTFAMTDDQGQLTMTLPRRPKVLSISIKQPGYGPYWASWNSEKHPQSIPSRFVAELDAGWSVGGVVVDSVGAPVAGVTVHPRVNFKKRPGETRQLGTGARIKTDAQGKWRFDTVPASTSDVYVAFNHPDYGPLRIPLPRDGFEVRLDESPSARIELKRGLTVTGTVTDEAGKPILGALVRTEFRNDIREARTDERGVYRLVGCEQRMARIVVSAEGRATDMQEVRVDPEMTPVNFVMKPGGKIRIRVDDEKGNGIPRARIFFQRWRGQIEYFEFDHISQYADENGVWEWNEAPLDEFQADIVRPGGMQLPRQLLIAREEEYVFRPPRALVVSGSVVDAKTKEPIKKFRVIPGARHREPGIGMNWIPRDSYEASDGKYRIRFRNDYLAHLVRIEADGYRVAISRDIMTDEGEVDVDFELQAAQDIAATILTAAGEPAANAKVALGITGSQIGVNQGDIDDRSTYATRLDADADGRFSIPDRGEPFELVITHSSGFAHLKSADGPIPNRITLTPWARVEGTFRVGSQPAPNVVLSMFIAGIRSYGDDVPNIFTHHDVTTGEDGRFVFERVFPGKGRIGRRILLMVGEGATEVTSSQRVPAEFIAGETTTLDLGGTGRPVVGKLAPPAGHAERVFWNFAQVNVQADLKAPPSPTAPEDVRDDLEKRKAWWDAWKVTDEGKAWTIAYEAYQQLSSESLYASASVDRDGSFRIDDMPSGDYVLRVSFSEHAAGSLYGYRFSVPAVDEGRAAERIDLGILTLDKQ